MSEIRNNMIDNDIENKRIVNQLWQGFNILRGVLPTEDLPIYLYLLSAYYEGVININDFNSVNNPYGYLKGALTSKSEYDELYEYYQKTLDSIPIKILNDLFQNLESIYIYSYDGELSELFDDLLFKLLDNQGKLFGAFALPLEIIRFINQIAESYMPGTGRDLVFNPFAGLGFLCPIPDKSYYSGQEANLAIWALGKVRLTWKFMDLESPSYMLKDSIKDWSIPDPENMYDIVISNPPFGIKIDSFYLGQNSTSKKISAEEYVIERGLDSIREDGSVLCVASVGFLFRGGSEAEMRKRLVENNQLDTIVYFPNGLLKHTGIPFCLVVVSRKGNSTDTIRMIDATRYVISSGTNKTLDSEALLESLNNINPNESVRYVGVDEIRENDYNLSVQRYFIDEYTGTPLKKILKPVKSSRVKGKRLGKYIRIRDLKDNDQTYTLNINEIEDKELPRSFKMIESSCVLLAIRWKSLKPTLFEYTGKPIYIGNDITALEIKNSKNEIDSNYLISELRSKQVIDQVNSYQNTGVIPFLNQKDIFKIKIDVPSPEEQRAKVTTILELSEKFKALQKERNALVHGQQIKSFDEFASLKHSLGAPRQNILSTAKSLIRFFETNQTNAFKEVKEDYKERYSTDLLGDLNQIKEDINHISSILEKGEKGLIMDNYTLSPVLVKDINLFLKDLKKNRSNYSIKYDQLKTAETSGMQILANLTLFKVLLDNILDNAEKYAFIENSKINEVVIELILQDDLLELVIKNNGVPFPTNYTRDKFIAKFSTLNSDNGTGIGGYDINRIAEYFKNPDWQLILNKADIYPVVFKFNFPLYQ